MLIRPAITVDAPAVRDVYAHHVRGSDNVPSIALHERHGFVRTGLLGGVGVKFGETLDVVLMQRTLAPDP